MKITARFALKSFRQERRNANFNKIIRNSILVLLLIVSLHTSNTAHSADEHGNDLSHSVSKDMKRNERGASTQTILSLEKAIEIAWQRDIWKQKSQSTERALTALSEGADTLPDPSLSLSLLNMPTDSFEFNQEPMSQLKLGISQLLPRGRSTQLQASLHQRLAQQQPFLRQNREAKIALATSERFLDAYHASASYAYVAQQRPFLTKLIDVVQAQYASVSGTTQQQDIIRAELELMRLDDKLLQLKTQQDIAVAKLGEYLFVDTHNSGTQNNKQPAFEFVISHAAPIIPVTSNPQVTNSANNTNGSLPRDIKTVLASGYSDQVAKLLQDHPSLFALEQSVRAGQIEQDIAKQAYKPQWGVNASYAYRDESDLGQARADFFSIGVSVNMPLFSSKRQDGAVSAKVHETEAMRTQKRLIHRELISALLSAYAQFEGALERQQFYERHIIPQTMVNAKTALEAYTNDRGDFAELVRAKIAELDAQLELLAIQTKTLKAQASMRYFLTQKSEPSLAPDIAKTQRTTKLQKDSHYGE